MDERPILYFTRFVPDYSVPPLQLLNSRLSGRLRVCSGDPPGSSSLSLLGQSVTRELPFFRLRNTWILGDRIHIQRFEPAFEEYPSPAIVLAEESPRSTSLPLLLRRARKAGSRTILWGHFSSNRRALDPEGDWRDRYRLRLARSADACICYTEEIAHALATHVPPERIFVARNTLDTSVLFRLDDDLRRAGRTEIRSRLGLAPDEAVVLFIGRLVPEKGLGLLLDAFEHLRERRQARLVVIGDGPGRTMVEDRRRSSSHNDIILTGALNRFEESAPWLYAADVALLPGSLGLAVNQAFSFGLPVVSVAPGPSARYHGPEAAYVRPGENGMFGSPDPRSLAGAVEQVLFDRDRFSAAARSFARNELTIERMVDGLEAAIRAVDR